MVWYERKVSSCKISVRQHLASLVMPNSYPRDGIFNPHLTTIKDPGQYWVCKNDSFSSMFNTLFKRKVTEGRVLFGHKANLRSFVCITNLINGPRQANLLLIAYASSEGSGEPAHPRSLARTSAARSYKQWVKRNLQTESQIPGPSEWLGMRN